MTVMSYLGAIGAAQREAMEADSRVIIMGEDVEARRSFITRNARDVRFLDV